MSKKRRHRTGSKYALGVSRAHGSDWNAMEWYVPFYDGHAIIYHGHEDPEDHSDCGPKIFCCPKAAILLLQRYPGSIPATAEWEFTEGTHLASWMNENGPHVYYFFFCDPKDGTLLRFCGIFAPEVRDVLLKRQTLDRYLENADRIYAIDQ